MIDLHSHSTASDGSCTPERLMDLAAERGLTAIALTDHDTLDGAARARARAESNGLRFIRGVEIEIEKDRGEFHLLGLGLSGDVSGLEAALGEIQRSRRTRNERMVEKFRAASIDITLDELAATAGGAIVSRAHFARLLVRKKIVGSIDTAFKRYLGKGMPFYEGRACLPLAEATRLIRSAGGIAVIAHPTSLGLVGVALRTFVVACTDQGVGGIEAWHPTHSVAQCHRLEHLAESLGMAVTGGSDFHGEHIPQRKLGFTAGGREVPDAFLSALPEGAAL
jgi:3',5'-nucleoside bisphosphate phosphatase